MTPEAWKMVSRNDYSCFGLYEVRRIVPTMARSLGAQTNAGAKDHQLWHIDVDPSQFT